MTITLGGPLLLVGAGKMGRAMLAGWLEQGLDSADICVQEPEPSKDLAELLGAHGISSGAAPRPPVAPAVVVIAVKPQAAPSVIPPLSELLGDDTVVLSVAAGLRLARLESLIGGDRAVVRAMPNTPAAIGRGITVACSNSFVTPAQAERCITLLSAIGEVEWIDDEDLMDPVTAVSGSGPAYVFLLCECLTKAGVEAGLDPEMAARLARATVSGAGELLRRADVSAAELRVNVTSPGGTTAAALEILNGRHGLDELLTRAVAAAAARSRELSS